MRVFDGDLRRMVRLTGILLLASLALTACDDDDETGPEDPEPEVEFLQLTVTPSAGAPQVVLVARTGGGVVTGGPIRVPSGGSATISARWLKGDNTDETIVTDDEFELSVSTAPGTTPVVSFARTGAFTGTLAATANGAGGLRFGLFHLEEQHDDFGPFAVPVSVP